MEHLCSAYISLSVNQTTSVSVGDQIEWDVVSQSGTGLTVDTAGLTTKGQFTLTPGIWLIETAIAPFATTVSMTYRITDTGGTPIGSTGSTANRPGVSTTGLSCMAAAVVQITTPITYEVRIASVSIVGSVSIENARSYLYIRKICGNTSYVGGA
jgi:hypothetical protein